MAVVLPPNSTGQTVDTVQATVGKERQIASIGEPVTGAAFATLGQFHISVNSSALGPTAYEFLTGAIKVTDPLGANDDAQNRRLLEQILIELQSLNSNFINSGLLSTAVQANETVQSVQ